MIVRSLGSGSSGNSYLIQSDGTTIVIDLGFPLVEWRKRVQNCRFAENVSAVLFTHDHCDHCEGAKAFRRAFPFVPFFANDGTADAISVRQGVRGEWNIFENGMEFQIGPFVIRAFQVPHDATDPVGYLIWADGQTLFVGTDMGRVTPTIVRAIRVANVAILESNHDLGLLMASKRRRELKIRISGPLGHLSNLESAELLRAAVPRNLKHLMLAHLSSECNTPELARKTAKQTLREVGLENVSIHVLAK